MIGVVIAIGVISAVTIAVCAGRVIVATRRWLAWRSIRRAHRRQRMELRRSRG